jgi:hypothetical protein
LLGLQKGAAPLNHERVSLDKTRAILLIDPKFPAQIEFHGLAVQHPKELPPYFGGSTMKPKSMKDDDHNRKSILWGLCPKFDCRFLFCYESLPESFRERRASTRTPICFSLPEAVFIAVIQIGHSTKLFCGNV